LSFPPAAIAAQCVDFSAGLRRERDKHAALGFRAAADPEERFLAGAETRRPTSATAKPR
jgi:hypothetical protein